MIGVSASVTIGPKDKRCRYWAKVIRHSHTVPAPIDVNSSNDVPGPYARNGDEELAPGDCLIEGEANHHCKPRGWSYRVRWCADDGRVRYFYPKAEIKAEAKAQGLSANLLKGSGDIAACIRIVWALRLGITLTDSEGATV